MSLEDGKEMIHCMWPYHIMLQCHVALDQFRRGLCETLQFGHLMNTYAEEAWGLLAASTAFNVTAIYLCDAFVKNTLIMDLISKQRKRPSFLCGMIT